MPQNTLNMFRPDHLGNPPGEHYHNATNPRRHAARHSVEANLQYAGEGNHDGVASVATSRPTSLQSSYSTNDLPTARDGNLDNAVTPPKSHRLSLSRGPANAGNPNPTKDSPEHDDAGFPGSQGQHTALQPSAAPFGPHMGTAASSMGISSSAGPAALSTFQSPLYGYGLQPYMGSSMQVPGQYHNYNPAGPYGAYPPYGNYRLTEGPAKGTGARRNGDGEAAQLSRFANFPLEHYQGDLYSLCKDQHGCRYLQRKLEERNPEHVQMIFNEIRVHVVELMTGMALTLFLGTR